MDSFRYILDRSLRLLLVWATIWITLSGQQGIAAEQPLLLQVPSAQDRVGDTLLAYSRSAMIAPVARLRLIKKAEPVGTTSLSLGPVPVLFPAPVARTCGLPVAEPGFTPDHGPGSEHNSRAPPATALHR